jgi:hypothetical protein
MIVSRLADITNMVIHLQVAIQSDAKYFDMIRQGNRGASNIEGNQGCVGVRTLRGTKQDSVRFVGIESKTIQGEPRMEGTQAAG